MRIAANMSSLNILETSLNPASGAQATFASKMLNDIKITAFNKFKKRCGPANLREKKRILFRLFRAISEN